MAVFYFEGNFCEPPGELFLDGVLEVGALPVQPIPRLKSLEVVLDCLDVR